MNLVVCGKKKKKLKWFNAVLFKLCSWFTFPVLLCPKAGDGSWSSAQSSHQHRSLCTSKQKHYPCLWFSCVTLLAEHLGLHVSNLCTHHSFFSEVDAHCGCELAVELVVGIPVEEGCLSHSRVPQRQKLDQIIIIPVSHCATVFSTCHSATCAGIVF